MHLKHTSTCHPKHLLYEYDKNWLQMFEIDRAWIGNKSGARKMKSCLYVSIVMSSYFRFVLFWLLLAYFCFLVCFYVGTICACHAAHSSCPFIVTANVSHRMRAKLSPTQFNTAQGNLSHHYCFKGVCSVHQRNNFRLYPQLCQSQDAGKTKSGPMVHCFSG